MPAHRPSAPFPTFVFSVLVATLLLAWPQIVLSEDYNYDPIYYTDYDDPPPLEEHSQEDFDKACECYTDYNADCLHILKPYEAYIVNGNCMGRTTTRRKRQRSDVEHDPFPLQPPIFYPENSCSSLSPMIFSSSGDHDRFTIGKTPFLLICRNSIGSHLKSFTVKGVIKVAISEGALAPRTTPITITFSDIRESLVIPEGGLSMQKDDARRRRSLEVDIRHHPPIKLHLKVSNVHDLELKSRSVVAPKISVDVMDAQTLLLGPSAIVPYVQPGSSSLAVTKTLNVVMEKHSVTMGHLSVTHTERLFMNDSAAAVGSILGGKVSLEHIANITLGTEALKMAPAGSLTLNSVVISGAGRRAIHTADLNSGALRTVQLTGVRGVGLESGAVCLLVETAVTHDLALEVNGGQAAGCIQALDQIQGNSLNMVVSCTYRMVFEFLCGSDECRQCNPDPTEPLHPTTQLTETSSIETTTDNVYFEYSGHQPFDAETETPEPFTILWGTETPTPWENTTPESLPANKEKGLEGIALYLLIVGVVAAILLCLLVTYCVWTYHNNKKRDKYRLPQEGRVSTFHNKAPDARAIATSEPIFTRGKPPPGPPPRDMYVSFQYFKPQETQVVENGSRGHPQHPFQDVSLRDDRDAPLDGVDDKDASLRNGGCGVDDVDDVDGNASLQANVSHDDGLTGEGDARQDSLMADDLPHESYVNTTPPYKEEEAASSSADEYEKSSKL